MINVCDTVRIPGQKPFLRQVETNEDFIESLLVVLVHKSTLNYHLEQIIALLRKQGFFFFQKT